jgi:ribosome-binding factor A
VSEALREELEELIVYELADPRIQVEGVAEVLISGDARRAHVRLLLLGDATAQKDTIEALEHARSFIRRQIARRLDLFRVPDLHFEPAIPAQLGPRVSHLLKRVRRGRPRPDSGEPEKSEPASSSKGPENE